jgi:hypothetical protein
MSRFEQRKAQGAKERLASSGVKVNPSNSVVYLESSGNPSDLLRQQNLYWKEGYDTLHQDPTGVYMHIPIADASANVKRYQQEARSRLVRPAPAGLDKEFREEGNVAGYDKPVSAQDFLEGE